MLYQHNRRAQALPPSGSSPLLRTPRSTPMTLLLVFVQLLLMATTLPVTSATSCLAGSGNEAVGVFAFNDTTCVAGGGWNGGLGCYTNNSIWCRYCQSFNTSQSQNFVACPAGIGTTPPPTPSPTPGNPTRAPSATPTVRPTTTTPASTTTTTAAPTAATSNPTPSPTNPSTTTTLFFDDFSQGFDLSQYKHEITMAGGGNWEFQIYRNNRTNSYVKNGILHITPTLTQDWAPGLGAVDLNGLTAESDCTSAFAFGCSRNNVNPISSARINTRSFSFTTGRLEVRAKLPRGDWLWPAIWLLPKYEQYGMWPVSGEIDVVESTGNAAGYATNRGVDSILSVLHWGLDYFQNKNNMTTASYTLTDGTDFSQAFHTFGLVRTDTGLYTYVDQDSNRVLEVDWSNQTFFERGGWNASHWHNPWEGSTSKGAPFDQEFFLTLNVAVGGISFFPDNVGNKPWNNTSPQASTEFWADKATWYPTWLNNDPTFYIDWINVTSL